MLQGIGVVMGGNAGESGTPQVGLGVKEGERGVQSQGWFPCAPIVAFPLQFLSAVAPDGFLK